MLARLLTTTLPVTPLHDRWLGLHADDPLPETVAAWIADQLATPRRDRTGTFSASATGRCERQQILRYLAHPEQAHYDPALAHRLEVGRWAHLRWQGQGLAAGWLEVAEVPVRLDEFGLTGTADGLLCDHEFGWEFKTIRHPGFNTVLKEGQPKFDHILQVTAYMMATGLRRWSVIYESTFSGEWKEFVVDFDPALVGLVKETLGGMAAAIEQRRLPPVLGECIERTGQYRDCPFRKDCLEWNQEGRTWPPSRALRILSAN